MRRQAATPVMLKRLRCAECQTPRDIPRRQGRDKAAGHVKHMFCATCKRESAFIEAE